MTIDRAEEFFGINPAAHRLKANLRQGLRIVAVGFVFLGGGLFLLQDFSYAKDLKYFLGLATFLTIGTACLSFGFADVYRPWRELAVLKAQPATDVLWYVLDGKGLHICNTMDHTPSGRALIPWTEMISVTLIAATEPVAQITYRGTSEKPSVFDAMANFSRRDGVRFGDRLKARFDRKGLADEPSVELPETTYSDEEIARFKRLLAEARLPREPVLGPDGRPVCAPPPPSVPDEPPTRDDRPEPPVEGRHTVP